MSQIDPRAVEGDSLLFQQSPFGGQAVGVAGESAVASDDAMTGNAGSIGISVQGLADGSIAGGFEAASDIGVGDHFSERDSRGDGPDFLGERHSGSEPAPADLILETG